MTDVHDYVDSHFDLFREQLNELLRIRSISTDPVFATSVEQAAHWFVEDMKRIGLERAEILPTGGHPVVYGEWLGAGSDSPTLLIYGHYDVQPAVKADGWHSEPF